MTSAQVEAVQNAYAAFQRGDIAAVLSALADDVEWIVPGQADPAAGVYKGKPEAGRFFQRLGETFEFTGFEPRGYLSQDSTVAARGWYSMIVRSTGKSCSAEWCHLWTFRGSQVARFQEYTDTEAIAAAFS